MVSTRTGKVCVFAVVSSALALVAGFVAPAASAAPVVQTFVATAKLQTFVVPTGICGVTIDAVGASGGSSAGAPGGVGAVVHAHLNVRAGSALRILVGQAGKSTTDPNGGANGGYGGFGGGGGGGGNGGGGGGGATAIFDAAGPRLTAGGGGGAEHIPVSNNLPGGAAGVLGADASPGASLDGDLGGAGGTASGDGGAAGQLLFPIPDPGFVGSAGAGGGVGTGGASVAGSTGGNGFAGFGGGGGSMTAGGGSFPPSTPHPGGDAGPTATGAGGLAPAGSGVLGDPGSGGRGTSRGGAGADTSAGADAGGGGGGGGAGFGGGGGGAGGGGGGGGYGGGGGGVGGGGGGSSWVTPLATQVSSSLASTHGHGSATVSYDPVDDRCPPVVQPGGGVVTAPTSGSADLGVSVSLSRSSTLTVTAHWTTLFVPGAPDSPSGPQAPTSDYVAASGTVTFAPGQTTAEVHISVTGGSSPSEYLVVSFTDPTNAEMGGFWGLGFGLIQAPS